LYDFESFRWGEKEVFLEGREECKFSFVAVCAKFGRAEGGVELGSGSWLDWGLLEKVAGARRRMFSTRTEYDRGVNTFSPDGRLFQVEYSLEAIKLGSTSIGICTKEGVVLAVEKRLTSPLVEADSVEKIMEIDGHIGAAMSGLVADARTLVDKARVEAQNHLFTYNEPIRVQSIAQAISDVAIGFGKGEDVPSRPFGVALLLAGVDEKGPQLYNTDPSGTFSQWDAKAIGSGSEGATNALQEDYNSNMSLDDGLELALKILRQVMEEKIEVGNVEVATVTKDEGYKLVGEDRLGEIIARILVNAANLEG